MTVKSDGDVDLSVEQIEASVAASVSYTEYNVADTIANLLGTASSNLDNAVDVEVTGSTIDVTQAATLVAASNSGDTIYNINDSAADVVGTTSAVRDTAANITLSDNATVSQATTVNSSGADSKTYAIVDDFNLVASALSTTAGTNAVLNATSVQADGSALGEVINLGGFTGTESKDLIVYGLAGNDQILTGDGNDTIYGGTGGDDIYGGNGNDNFVFTTSLDSPTIGSVITTPTLAIANEIDVIRDFGTGSDTIDLSAITGLSNSSTVSKGAEIVATDQGDVFVLTGVGSADNAIILVNTAGGQTGAGASSIGDFEMAIYVYQGGSINWDDTLIVLPS